MRACARRRRAGRRRSTRVQRLAAAPASAPAGSSWSGCVDGARHVEVQVFGDGARPRGRPRRPRLLAAAPQPEGGRGGAGARPARRGPRAARTIGRARSCASVDYRSAGTVEFVYDADREEAVVPRGQHAAAGRAPGHRGGVRRRPGRVDAAARRRATTSRRRRRPAAPSRRTPSRRGSTPRTPAATTARAPA